MDIIELFGLGMKRMIMPLRDAPQVTGIRLNLGGGNQVIPGYLNLDYPEWDATKGIIPWDNASVDAIYAFHFLEHLDDPRPILRECMRVLIPDGIMNIVVPYYTSQMQAHDFDHKSVYCEESWRNLLQMEYYVKDKQANFVVGTNVIIGVVERNLSLMTQLIRI